ncbi:MAG: TRAP transporter large permease subunit [Deltaproteobacteria bacterium]|nr:TRAP transporter large permease subunit [Deltaproteobacteria bacterium]
MTTAVIGAIALLVLIGAPLFTIVGIATLLCLIGFTELSSFMDLRVLVQHIENLATKQEFLAIPLFIASGAVMTEGGIARRLVNLMRALLAGLPGGLGVAAVAACMFFAAISGSSPVTLIAVGSMMFPALTKHGYSESFSLGLVTTAGSLGCLVPPSISMLIYAISVSGTATVDPSDLFLAGMLPAMLIAGLLSVYSIWVGSKIPGERERFSWPEVKLRLEEGSWAVALPVIVLGGIYGGWYTPSQAGAVAVVYSLVVTIWIHRELDLGRAIRAMVESAQLMGALLPIIVLAFGLNEFLALIDVQDKVVELIKWIDPSPAGFLLIVNVVLIVLGALMDSISATLIFAPLLAPAAYELFHIDPIHFGIIFVVNMEIGYLMPPVATNLFVASAIFVKPFGFVSRAVIPTLTLTILALGLIIYLPSISLAAIHFRDDKPLWVAFPWDGKPKDEAEGHTTPPTGLGALTGKIAAGLDDEEGATATATPSLKSLTGKIMKDLDEESDAPPTPTLKGLTNRIMKDLDEPGTSTTP